MGDPRELELARRELQRLGYLSHRVERFLLRDALEPVGEPRALALLAGKVGLLAGMLLALANTLALASANGLLANAPFDLLPLFFHLLPPLVAAGFVSVQGVVCEDPWQQFARTHQIGQVVPGAVSSG